MFEGGGLIRKNREESEKTKESGHKYAEKWLNALFPPFFPPLFCSYLFAFSVPCPLFYHLFSIISDFSLFLLLHPLKIISASVIFRVSVEQSNCHSIILWAYFIDCVFLDLKFLIILSPIDSFRKKFFCVEKVSVYSLEFHFHVIEVLFSILSKTIVSSFNENAFAL